MFDIIINEVNLSFKIVPYKNSNKYKKSRLLINISNYIKRKMMIMDYITYNPLHNTNGFVTSLVQRKVTHFILCHNAYHRRSEQHLY